MLSARTGLTVTLHVADLSPQAAVIVASPTDTAVTLPSASTVATDASDVVQTIVLSVTSSGNTVAVSFADAPMVSESSVLSRAMLSARTGLTVTLHVADLSPQAAVIVASPTDTAVTLPSASTVATDASDVDHVTVLSVTFSGRTVAASFADAPIVSESSVLSRAMLSARTGLTVTLHVADLSPQAAVIVASPTDTAVTLPSASTVATDASDVVQTIVLSVTSSGNTVAVSFADAPMVSESSVLSRAMLSARTGLTVTLHVADLSPQAAVIVASPTDTAVTLPSASTVATDASDVVQTIVLSVTSSGNTVAVSFADAPMVSESSVLSRAMLSARTGLTVTLHVADLSPQAAVIVASPTDTAVTLPSASTVATDASDVVQTIVLSVTSSGNTVAVSFADAPMVSESSVLSRAMLSARTGLTVTLHVADLSPQAAVIVASPTDTAVTLPSASTVATDASDVDHVTVLSVTSSGNTVAVSLAVLPRNNSSVSGKITFSAG